MDLRLRLERWEVTAPPKAPHWIFMRVLADCLIGIGLIGSGVFVKAWATGMLPPPTPLPWGTIVQAGGTVATAVLAWLLRGQVQQLHLTFNSKMDEYVKLVKAAAEAEGVLKERARSDAIATAKAEGVVEGKEKG